MASEPYCAAAPSRKTSILSIAPTGIAFKSVPTEPRPTVELTFTNAVECCLFPLTKTKTWSGPSPRKVAGSMWSVPLEIVWRAELKEGAEKFIIWVKSV